MTNYSKLYWLTRLDGFHGLLTFLIVVSCISVFVFCLFYLFTAMDDYDDDIPTYVKRFGKYRTIFIIIGLLAGVVKTFVPTRNELIVIYVGGKTMNFVQSDSSINKIPAQTTKLITDYLQDALKDTKEDKK